MLFSDNAKKVELGLMDDFNKAFEKALDNHEKLSNAVIDALARAESLAHKLEAAGSGYATAEGLGKKALAAAKELGIDLDSATKNRIESASRGSKDVSKESQSVRAAIKKAYGAF